MAGRTCLQSCPLRQRFGTYDKAQLTVFTVAVAWARKIKLEALNEVVRYELKVALSGELASRAKKNGIAVIVTIKDDN